MKRLVTPKANTTLQIYGHTLTGGRDFLLTSEVDSYIANQLQIQRLTVLSIKDNPILLPDNAKSEVLEQIVREQKKSKPWNPKEEKYEQYISNVYIFAAEAYASELNGESEVEEKPKTSRKTTQEPKPQPE